MIEKLHNKPTTKTVVSWALSLCCSPLDSTVLSDRSFTFCWFLRIMSFKSIACRFDKGKQQDYGTTGLFSTIPVSSLIFLSCS